MFKNTYKKILKKIWIKKLEKRGIVLVNSENIDFSIFNSFFIGCSRIDFIFPINNELRVGYNKKSNFKISIDNNYTFSIYGDSNVSLNFSDINESFDKCIIINLYNQSSLEIKNAYNQKGDLILNLYDESKLSLDNSKNITINKNSENIEVKKGNSSIRVLNNIEDFVFCKNISYFERGSKYDKIQRKMKNQFSDYSKRDKNFEFMGWEKSLNNYDENYTEAKKQIETIDYGVPIGEMLGLSDIICSTESNEAEKDKIKKLINKLLEIIGEEKLSLKSFQIGKNEGRTNTHKKFIYKLKNENNIENIKKELFLDIVNKTKNTYQLTGDVIPLLEMKT